MELTKTHFYQSQLMIITGLLEHTRDNIEGTIFGDDESLTNILSVLAKGLDVALERMNTLVLENEDEDCCGCC